MIDILLFVLGWIAVGYFVMRNSSSFAMFSRGPSWFELVLIFPFALICCGLDKLDQWRKKK